MIFFFFLLSNLNFYFFIILLFVLKNKKNLNNFLLNQINFPEIKSIARYYFNFLIYYVSRVYIKLNWFPLYKKSSYSGYFFANKNNSILNNR